MVAKIGSMIELESGKKFLVDDIQKVDGEEYLVLYLMEDNAFLIATEKEVDKKVVYEFLGRDEALKVATAIDNNKN